VIKRFREFKGDKFSHQAIVDTFDRLDSAGLFA
jgi:hypothetical protein